MAYALDDLKKRLELKLEAPINFPPLEIEADLAVPSFKSNPNKLAEKITALGEPLIEKVEVAGGYVNLTLNKKILAGKILAEVSKFKNKYGWEAKKNKTILIDYSSPNIAKPMHIGHLRTTVLGMALKNIYLAGGYKVVGINYLGDWGTQFGKLALAWQKFGPAPLTIENLFDLYVKINQETEKDEQLEQEARDLFKKMEEGDKKLLALWKKFRDCSVKDFKKTYKELGTKFEVWSGESLFKKDALEIIKEAVKKGVATQEYEAAVVNLEKFGLKSYILAKSDGATLYAARDLAAAKWRFKKYRPEKNLYITGQEQEFYFKQIFKTLSLLGYAGEKMKHIGYNLVTIGGKKAATRKGRVVFLKDVLKEAVKKAKGNKKIGVIALIFNNLSQKRSKPI